MEPEKEKDNPPQIQSRLIPILREGVDIVRMVLFKELKSHMGDAYPARDPGFAGRLSGAVLNDLFGIENLMEPFAGFRRENQALITEELHALPHRFGELRIPLTDALRVQFLCDSREGIDSESVLVRANELGILMIDRDIPLPRFFMNMVRRLGVAHRILDPDAVLAIPEDDDGACTN
ncbi:hypothetical protein [Desulfococcus sp.]|uniref:hypothetical protein n=1 Tax=Desulfococcus sp. TaxID=2025834 RepID=UPI003593E02F